MGLGHVPPGEVPAERAGTYFPRRQRRGTRAVGALPLDNGRRSLGGFGERFAAWYLTDKGLSVIAANVRVQRGEIDLLVMDGHVKVAVEVRTTTNTVDPIDAADERKRRQVWRLARAVGANRIDFLGLRLDRAGVDVHWLPGGN